jgi:hypothetical protein
MPRKNSDRLRRTQANRKHSAKGKQPKGSLSERNISGRTRGSAPCPAPGVIAGSYFLNPKLKQVSPLDINSTELFIPEINSGEDREPMGDMEVWVPALYHCLKGVPGFKDESHWSGYPTIHDLARYLIKKTGELAPKDFDWAFYRDCRNELALCYYKVLGKYDNGLALSVEWIPKLTDENPVMGQLALEMISKVATTWYMDIIHTEHVENVVYDPGFAFHETEEELFYIQQKAAEYKEGGHIYRYASRMRKISESVSLESLKNKVAALRSKDIKETSFKLWMELGISVLENPGRIGEYMPPDFMCDQYECSPLTINEIFSIHWSIYDPVFKSADANINAYYHETVLAPPTVSYFFGKKKADPMKYSEKQVELLAEFMTWGRKFYFDYYDKFYEDLYNDPENESRLINVLA